MKLAFYYIGIKNKNFSFFDGFLTGFYEIKDNILKFFGQINKRRVAGIMNDSKLGIRHFFMSFFAMTNG